METKEHSDLLRRLESLGLGEGAYSRLKSLVELMEQAASGAPGDLAAQVQRTAESSRLKTLFLQLVSRELGGAFDELRKRVDEMAEEPDPWKLREGLRDLSETLYRLNGTVRNLIDTSGIESGAVKFRRESVDLSSMVSDRISRRLRRLRGYRIQPELPSGALRALADRERLSLLMDDLLDAAIHLSPQGGTILVRLARKEEEIVLSTECRTARLPESRPTSILEWLEEDIEEAGELEGTGLSLYRAHRTAEMLGGRMDVAALEEEGGVSFTVRIPFAEESPAPHA
ncbi:MAG: hypothetical protein A3J27_07785 [Candidatus Tectomicrobia bacterium RIFCSPLOWO2_12_FULL_69_37]|nr:MAG: hypothetical protein A3I72_14405 [Candidatus Tectomicrobia bacterium RIFCSPLOWO2_02_FULL_70_19]OGL66839.1 MAG: hypothetical protein A3J27_07785 [Candidatus Tectomicrobia bacterium RIFCSPLOWO2_12_FULL_69_37]